MFGKMSKGTRGAAAATAAALTLYPVVRAPVKSAISGVLRSVKSREVAKLNAIKAAKNANNWNKIKYTIGGSLLGGGSSAGGYNYLNSNGPAPAFDYTDDDVYKYASAMGNIKKTYLGLEHGLGTVGSVVGIAGGVLTTAQIAKNIIAPLPKASHAPAIRKGLVGAGLIGAGVLGGKAISDSNRINGLQNALYKRDLQKTSSLIGRVSSYIVKGAVKHMAKGAYRGAKDFVVKHKFPIIAGAGVGVAGGYALTHRPKSYNSGPASYNSGPASYNS